MTCHSTSRNPKRSAATSAETTIALAGNPNSGKSTVFNNLTGARQHVGNWPGVTVEKKEGYCRFGDRRIMVVDLPGVYSLTAYSLDEVIARDFLVDERPDVVVDVVDASNLERNLYLTVQLLEMGVKLVIALNMMDVAASRGYGIDVARLAGLLGVPVVPLVAARNQGTVELLEAIDGVAGGTLASRGVDIRYGHDVEAEITKLETLIGGNSLAEAYPPRWLAVKLLEADKDIVEKIRQVSVGQPDSTAHQG
jgi:ferrous iron transport protein B